MCMFRMPSSKLFFYITHVYSSVTAMVHFITTQLIANTLVQCVLNLICFNTHKKITKVIHYAPTALSLTDNGSVSPPESSSGSENHLDTFFCMRAQQLVA